jgi:hypothetical protein
MSLLWVKSDINCLVLIFKEVSAGKLKNLFVDHLCLFEEKNNNKWAFRLNYVAKYLRKPV